MRKIIVNENTLKLLESIDNKPTFEEFQIQVKFLLKEMIMNPYTFKLNNFWIANGFNKNRVLNYLLKNNIIVSDDIDGVLEYKVPRLNFRRKLKIMYITFFEKNLPTKETPIEENDGGGGATTTGGVGTSGINHIDVPLFGKPIKQKKQASINETHDKIKTIKIVLTGDFLDEIVPILKLKELEHGYRILYDLNQGHDGEELINKSYPNFDIKSLDVENSENDEQTLTITTNSIDTIHNIKDIFETLSVNGDIGHTSSNKIIYGKDGKSKTFEFDGDGSDRIISIDVSEVE